MSSTREQVVEAVVALVRSALPFAEVIRNADKPEVIPAGGMAIVDDGDPGEPDVDLSPLAYNYDHRIPVLLGAYDTDSQTREQVLDQLLVPIGQEVEDNRQLGGLCTWLDVEAPDTDNAEAYGAETSRWADFVIVASYSTSNPLT